MKAVIFALTVLLGYDLAVHEQGLFATIGAFGRGIGAWIFYTG